MKRLRSTSIAPSFFEPCGVTRLAWLGMAGLLVNARGTVLMIDPLLVSEERDGRECSETGLPLKVPLPIAAEAVPRLDVVMFTHAEDDHCGKATARALDEHLKPTFFAPPPVFERLRDVGIDEDRQVIARDFETFRIGNNVVPTPRGLGRTCDKTPGDQGPGATTGAGDVEITVTPALHDHDAVNPWKRGDCVGFLIRTSDGSIWHPGDSRLIDELLEFRDVDVLLWDVTLDIPAHLCPPGSAALAKSSGAKALLAYHYGTMEAPEKGGSYQRALESDPAASLPFVKDLSAPFLRLDPGEPLRLPRS